MKIHNKIKYLKVLTYGPLLTLCHVVRTSGLLGPERVTQALKIILTVAEQKETSHASSAVCPRVDEPARENGYHRESIGLIIP